MRWLDRNTWHLTPREANPGRHFPLQLGDREQMGYLSARAYTRRGFGPVVVVVRVGARGVPIAAVTACNRGTPPQLRPCVRRLALPGPGLAAAAVPLRGRTPRRKWVLPYGSFLASSFCRWVRTQARGAAWALPHTHKSLAAPASRTLTALSASPHSTWGAADSSQRRILLCYSRLHLSICCCIQLLYPIPRTQLPWVGAGTVGPHHRQGSRSWLNGPFCAVADIMAVVGQRATSSSQQQQVTRCQHRKHHHAATSCG